MIPMTATEQQVCGAILTARQPALMESIRSVSNGWTPFSPRRRAKRQEAQKLHDHYTGLLVKLQSGEIADIASFRSANQPLAKLGASGGVWHNVIETITNILEAMQKVEWLIPALVMILKILAMFI